VGRIFATQERIAMTRIWTRLTTAAAITAALLATGCNTAKGFGEDLSTLGDKITGTAEKHTPTKDRQTTTNQQQQ
jgi:predicted small secreted protein